MKKIITILSLLLSLSHLCFGQHYVVCVIDIEPRGGGCASITGVGGNPNVYKHSCSDYQCDVSVGLYVPTAYSGYKFAYWSATGLTSFSPTIKDTTARSTTMTFSHHGKWKSSVAPTIFGITGTDTIHIIAHFVPSSLTLTTSALPAEGGTVTEGGSFEYGTNKTIEATPNPEYQFVMWDDGSTDNPRSVVVTGNATYTAIFEPTEQTSPNNSKGALNGLFSVSADKTVRFSMGNLQYRASTNTWRFAMNQWHAIGQDNANIASDYDGWIDMFGWGTSGWNSGAVCYQPFSSSKNDSDYYVGGNSKNNLIGDYANADWGVYNKITNGGNQVDLWNTLTTEEWKYLIEERTNANNLRGIGTVNGMNGLILLPDNWDTPEGLEFNTNFGSETNRNLYPTTNSFTLSQWKQMEDRGAIFLPACDLGHEINSNFNVLGHYWSSIGAENLRFSSQDIKYQVNDRYSGMSVRLVQESYSIQVIPSDIEKGETSGSGIYRKNEEIEITATPNPDYQFVMWDDGSTDNPRSIVVTGNATYTAIFEPTEQTSPNNSNGALNGLFSVSADKTVRFSMGNLQYRASTSELRFAERQWIICGVENKNISPTYSGWIDLFGWGTGKNPSLASSNNSDYAVFSDWGDEKIINGGNEVNLWQTMSSDEWEYLINGRPNASNLRGVAQVNGVNGWIILPDNWLLPDGMTFNAGMSQENGAIYYQEINTYSLSQWQLMENVGAIFLPAAGHRSAENNNDIRTIGIDGNYRTSTSLGDFYTPIFDFRSNSLEVKGLLQGSYGRSEGRSVRLVQESYSIQVIPSDIEMGQTSGSGVYRKNEEVEITATPNPDYQFVMWNDGSTDNPRSIVVTGNATYTATFSYVGHSYGVPTYVWNTDSTQCTATRICSNDASHIETETATSSIDTTAATCINTGLITYTVSFTNTAFTAQTVTKEIPVLGHDYEKESWSWSSDYKTASLKFVCQNDANHTETINAEVTIDTIEATCLTNGRIVYTATAILDNSEYTETTDATLQIEVRPRLNNNTIGKFSLCGSDYQFLIKSNDPWTELQFEIWKEGVKCSKTDFAASNLNTHSDWVQPDNWYFNASQNNVTGYWLIYNPTENTLQYQTSEPNCMEYTDTKEVTLPATGHTEIIDNSVVPTCTTTGVTEGKHCSVCGSTIIAQTKLPALGHTYIKDSWTWASDFSSASVKFICQNDASHVETINAVVTTDTTKETCMSDGKIAYTAIATLDGTEFTDTKETTVQIEVKPRLNIATTGNFSSCGSNYKFMLKSDNQYTESQFEIWKDGVKCIKTDFVSTNLNTHSDWAQPDNWYFNASPNNVTGYWLIYNPTENTLQYQTSEPNCTEYITDTKEIILPALKPTTHTITEISYGEFTLNGQTYNESGVYTQMLTNSQGCDSVLTINLTVKKEEDLELSVLEQFTTCEYRDAIQIESYTEGMNFTWSINGEIDKTQTGDTYRIPSSAPLNGIVKVTGTIGTISISKTIQYSIYKEIAKKMWDDVVSIINPKHEFVAFEWYHNDKKISNAEYYNELGGVTGFYYVIATDKENEKIHSCILNFEADSQLKLFPNPTEGEVTFINDGNTEVRIFDTTGKLLATETIIPADGYSTIDLSSYPQGIYYLHIGKNIFKVVRK